MSDEDSPLEDDETEFLVYVEFEGTSKSDIFTKENIQLDMIGLDMEHPIMRVNGRYYEGTYEDAVGTYMFFDKDKDPVVDDPVFDVPPKLKYSTKTRKMLRMRRVFVKPRLEVMEDSGSAQCPPDIEKIKAAGVPPAYQEEALNIWKDMQKDRLEALNEYLEKQKIREEKRQKGIEPDSASDEDTPFAMYMKKPNNSEDSHMKSPEKLNVIDPGPSTSKEHIYPPNYGSNGTTASGASSSPIKNQGYIGFCGPRRKKTRNKVDASNANGAPCDDGQSKNSEESQCEVVEVPETSQSNAVSES